jgi:spore coat protein SA
MEQTVTRRRIALVAQPYQELFPPEHALGIWMREIASRLATRDDVVVYYLARKPEPVRREDGVEYRAVTPGRDVRLQRVLDPLYRSFLPPTHPFFASPLHLRSFWARVASDVALRDFEIIHVLNNSQALHVLRRAAPSAKLVLHMECEWLSQLDRGMIERRLRDADLVIGCSAYITKRIQARFPELAHRCITVYNGATLVDVDAEAVPLPQPPIVAGVSVEQLGGAGEGAPSRGRQRLLFVGRISPEKGVHVLMNAFEQLVEQGNDVELVLVGDEAKIPPHMLARLDEKPEVRALESYFTGAYEGGYLRGLIDRLPADVKSRIKLAGPISYPDVLATYHGADVLVLPSVCGEAFGIPIAEAMAAGIPVVASRVGGIPELVADGETGLLVEPDDSQSLADALLEVVRDRKRGGAMGTAGRRRAEALYTWDRAAEALSSAFAALMDDERGRRVV